MKFRDLAPCLLIASIALCQDPDTPPAAAPGVEDGVDDKEAGKGTELDPRRLLWRAWKRNLELKTFVFDCDDATVDGDGRPIPDRPRHRFSAKVERGAPANGAEAADDFRHAWFRFRAKSLGSAAGNDGRRLEFDFDGETLRDIAHDEKTIVAFPVKEARITVWELPESSILVEGLIEPCVLRIPPNAPASYRDPEVLDGTPCHVLEARVGIGQCGTDPKTGKKQCVRIDTRVRFWIGKDDLLVRRVSMCESDLARAPKNAGEVWVQKTFTGVKAGVTFAAGDLRVDTPDDYQTQSISPEQLSNMYQAPGVLSDESTKRMAGKTAPDFELQGTDGKTHRLEDYRGKVVLLDFWGTWCGPCVASLPFLKGIDDEFSNDEVVVLGVACNEQDLKKPAAVLSKAGCSHVSVLEGEKTAAAYGIRGYPTLVIIDPKGAIVSVHIGGLDSEGAAKVVEEIKAVLERD